MPTKPITYGAATRRIHAAGLNLTNARAMPDNDLLRFPTITRRTLAFIRANEAIDDLASSRPSISVPPLAYIPSTYSDSTTRALDRLAEMQMRKNWILEISEIILIPAVILSGITGIVYFLV